MTQRDGRWCAARGMALAAVLLVTAGCGTAERGGPPGALPVEVDFVGVADRAEPDAGMADASRRLAGELLTLVPGDAVVSPLSLQLALAMLREGADGVVAEEVDAAAGLSRGSRAVADLRALLAEHEGEVASIDPDDPPKSPLVHVADSVFVQEGFAVGEDFLAATARYHGAAVHPVDFSAGSATPALDAWVREATGGLLEEAPHAPSRDARVVLLNAVTFGATWAQPFEDTREEPFTRADGAPVEVPMMTATLETTHAAGLGWAAVEVPYSEGFVMRAVLPESGAVAGTTWHAAHDALDSALPEPVELAMPRWETETTVELAPVLAELGLGSLLDPRGELDQIFPGAAVESVAQGAVVHVGERGTVASTVTQVTVAEVAGVVAAVRVRLDRPFEYQVLHEETGLVLFAGRVADPS